MTRTKRRTTPRRPPQWARRSLSAATSLLLLLVLAGCTLLSPRADHSRFFVLTPLPNVAAETDDPSDIVLGIGPLTFPRHLDRSEMITRVGSNEVRVATFHYWSGSLVRQFEYAFSQNLRALSGADRIQAYPGYAGAAPDSSVEVDVARFERGNGNQLHLSARWRIRNGRTGGVLHAGRSEISRPGGDPDPAKDAAFLSDMLGDFSREIAQTVRSLAQSK